MNIYYLINICVHNIKKHYTNGYINDFDPHVYKLV